jgi:predicted permease
MAGRARKILAWRAVDGLALDLRYALRSLAKNSSFALGVCAVLTLVLAANIAVFSVVDAVLVKPLPYPDADRIVTLENFWTNTGRIGEEVSGPDFLDWREQSRAFDAMAVVYGNDDEATVVGERAVFANARYVSSDFFTVFGQSAAAGRLLTEQDLPPRQESPDVAVVAHAWAAAHFGSAEAALGKQISVYGNTLTIVGVAASGFRYPDAADIWTPWRTEDRAAQRGNHSYHAVAKLAADVPLASAQAEMRAIAGVLAQQYPENRLKSVAVTPLQERLTARLRGTLWLLMAASGAVLLVACANIAGLLLVRAAERAREIAVRAALGAGRARVARQLLIEGGVLAAASGAAGVLLASLLTRTLVALSPQAPPAPDASLLDARVLSFALGISLLALLSFGVVPALRASSLDLMNGLRGGSKLVTASGGARLRSTIVIAEVALSLVLLVTGGLLLKSFLLLQHVDLGFRTDRLVFAYMQHVGNTDEEMRARRAFYAELLTRVRGVPGVSAAAGITSVPLGDGDARTRDILVDGRSPGQLGERPRADFYAVTPEYFATLAIPLHAGRDFTDGDNLDRPMVAVVNEAFVRTVLNGEPALGQRVRWNERVPWLEIVGVVGDTRWQNPSRPPPPTLYVSSWQGWGTSLSLAARTSLDADALGTTIGALARELDPVVPVRLESVDDRFASAVAKPRFIALVVGAFATLAALLATVGLFSVLAYTVGQRHRELAVRRALGARASDILKVVVGQGLRMAAVGLAIGLAAASAATRLLSGVLYEVSAWDAASYAGAAGVLGVAAILATLVPALRAVRIEPQAALKDD